MRSAPGFIWLSKVVYGYITLCDDAFERKEILIRIQSAHCMYSASVLLLLFVPAFALFGSQPGHLACPPETSGWTTGPGPSRSCLVPVFGCLGGSGACLEPSRACLGLVLGCIGPVLNYLEPFWKVLDARARFSRTVPRF